MDALLMANSTSLADSQSSLDNQSDDWWRHDSSINNRKVSPTERIVLKKSVDNIWRPGRCCVITGQEYPVRMARLIPRSTDFSQLQYSFGRRLDLNCRWFNFYLTRDWYGMFHGTSYGWALIPAPEVIIRIANKMRAEQERRCQLGITGPWPDYRQPSWFPTTKEGYTYHLTPLGLAHSPAMMIPRRKDMDDPSAATGDWEIYLRPYDNFPVLNLHIHPYAAILNAFPKLEKHLATKSLPAPADSSYGELRFIHETLTCAYQETEAPTSPPAPQPHHSSRRSGTETSTGTLDVQSTPCPRASSEHTVQSTTHSSLSSPERDRYDDPFDYLDEHSERLRDGFDDPTLNHLDIPRDVNGAPSYTLHPLFVVLERKVVKWVSDVERVRGHGALLEPQPDSSPEAAQYAEELARPPILDWHDWTSDFVPWWTVLPKRKNRGILSSNDWVVIRNLPSLTGGLDNGRMA